MVGGIIAVLCAGIALFELYFAGLVPVSSKRAVMFSGSMDGKRVSFASCSGYIKRIVRFRSDGSCTMRLAAELTKGDMWVELSDSGGNLLAHLDGQGAESSFPVRAGERYRLLVRFKGASGKYDLDWNED